MAQQPLPPSVRTVRRKPQRCAGPKGADVLADTPRLREPTPGFARQGRDRAVEEHPRRGGGGRRAHARWRLRTKSMTVSPDDARHLTFVTLDALWKHGAPIEIPIKGEPACRLQLDPKSGLITLVTRYETPEPDVARLKNVGFNAISSGDEDLAELTVRVEGNVHGAY